MTIESPQATPVTAAVLIIGNEILSGRTQDTNLAYLAKKLNEYGIQIRQARVVPDVEHDIVEAVNALRERHDYVFTTGGIGPTHDDITADCIAAAFGVDLVVSPEIAAILERRPAPPEIMAARMRMARMACMAEPHGLSPHPCLPLLLPSRRRHPHPHPPGRQHDDDAWPPHAPRVLRHRPGRGDRAGAGAVVDLEILRS